ncbi:MAG: twin-arginine translocation pathway signal protein, partial [Bacteroidetes bacterium]
MERREVLKSIGLLSFVSAVGMFSACTEKEQKETHEEKEIKTVKSEENELIVNRQEMKIQDSENPTKLELKHTPEIVVKEEDGNGFTKVDVTIGSQGIIHPS